MNNKHQKMYIKNLRKYIPIGYPHTEQFISSISQDMEHYLEQHADADYDDICLEFGSPKELASSLMDEVTPKQMNETFCKQKKMKRKIYLLYAILFVFVGVLFVVLASTPKEIETTTYIYETEYIYVNPPIESEAH